MTKKVAAQSRFVEAPDAPSTVLQWFRDQGSPFNEHGFDWGAALYFAAMGELRALPDGSIDREHSPVVSVHLPKVRRGIFWTVGEVRFCPIPLRQFPELERLRRTFLRWFDDLPLIYEYGPQGEHEFDYYLEGSVLGYGPIRALPSGLAALKRGQYFISQNESEGLLTTVCKKLALRGVTCAASD